MKGSDKITNRVLKPVWEFISKINHKKTTYAAVCAFAGAVLAQTSVWGGKGMLVAALTSVLPAALGGASVIGGLISAVLFGITPEEVAALASSVCVILVRLWFDNVNRLRYPLAASIAAGIVYASGRFLECRVAGLELIDYLEASACSALLMGAVLFSAKLFKTCSLSDIRSGDAVSMAAISSLIVCGAASLSFYAVNPGLILCFLAAVLSLSLYSRAEALSFTLSASLGLMLCDMSAESHMLYPLILILLCPDAIRKSKVFLGLYTLLGGGVLSFFCDEGYDLEAALSAIIAASLFFIIPEKAILAADVRPVNFAEHTCGISGRLSFLADGADKLLDQLPAGEYSVTESVGERVYTGLCVGCESHSGCYDDGRQTAQIMLAGLDELKNVGRDYFAPFCQRADDAARLVKETKRKLSYVSEAERRISAKSSGLRSALAAAGKSLRDASDESSAPAGLIKELYDSGIACEECVYDPEGCAELYFKSGIRLNEKKLCRIAGRWLHTCVEVSSRIQTPELLKLTLLPVNRLRPKVGSCSLPKEAGGCTGDSVSIFENSKYLYLLLCDGMGTGEEAASYATTLAKNIRMLIESGFCPDSAISLSAELMRCSFPEECFSTVDLTQINLLTGRTVIKKFGAAKSIAISEKGEQQIIASGGYPIGIIEGCLPYVAEVTIKPGDAIVMLSDGADSLDPGRIASSICIEKNVGENAVASKLAHEAFVSRRTEQRDDVSVAVISLA